MAKKKKKKKNVVAPVAGKPSKPIKDLPTQDLSFVLTVPGQMANQFWQMRHHWNIADPGWTWVKMINMCIVLVRLEAGMRSQIPALLEIGHKISQSALMFEIVSPVIARDATGQKLEAVIDDSPALRDLQGRLGSAAVSAGFSLRDKIRVPRVLLSRRQEGVEPSRTRPTELMTVANLDWVASRFYLVESLPGRDGRTTTSLRGWPLAKDPRREG